MQRGVLALALAAVLAVALAAPADDKYTDKYDNIDIDEILSNDRLFKKYLECMLAEDDSRCTADGKELRKSLPEAMTNKCAKCTDKQKSISKKVIDDLRANKPTDWEKIQAKWDPEGIYLKTLAE